MKQIVFLFFLLFTYVILDAQPMQNEHVKEYRGAAEKINDLVHTKIDARFDYSKSYMYGKVWITLKPHFYPTDSLALDAKGMDIHQVSIEKNEKRSPLKYDYDGMILNIKLDKTYKNSEPYTIYIDYTSKPNEFQGQGSAAITEAKGLYFINPLGEDKSKPTQIWTQGETEATSVWVPTIDKPDQKTTEEIYMTIPSKYVTLSNGRLADQKINSDGTRTDHWKMDLPHAPYLFFMGVGDYAIIKDKYKGKEVNYYVEKEYASLARKIFGLTPEMMALFSKLTGVDYPWVKYSQITGRDYVSGAMENTTATLHTDALQQDARQLLDENKYEDYVSHELFHQWFGDYVTAESWSNITLNESFADYSEYLWREYKYGKEDADAHRHEMLRQYYVSHSEDKNLVRFYYEDKEDVFDAVSYNKGGGILHMLRNFVGDSAFYKALNLYLNTYKFKSAEAQQLRIAFEDVTGKDLNWFWNQWYYGSGHPKLNINYSYDNNAKRARVIVSQTTGKLFTLPVKIALWNNNSPSTYNVWVKNKIDTFSFASSNKPDLIDFDADKILVAQNTENKTLDEYLFQYQHGDYEHRKQAIDTAAKNQSNPVAQQILLLALKDKFFGLRINAIDALTLTVAQNKTAAEPVLFEIAQNDSKRLTRAAAIAKLGYYRSPNYLSFFKNALNDSSYSVSGNALQSLYFIDSASAVSEAKHLSSFPAKSRLQLMINRITYAGQATKILSDFESMQMNEAKFKMLQSIFDIMGVVSSMEVLKRTVDDVLEFEKNLPKDARNQQLLGQLNGAMRQIQKQKLELELNDQADYIDSKLRLSKGF